MERKARKQFKGLFDKKPGEISEVSSDDKEQKDSAENTETVDELRERDSNIESKESPNCAVASPRRSWFSFFWPTGRNFHISVSNFFVVHI